MLNGLISSLQQLVTKEVNKQLVTPNAATATVRFGIVSDLTGGTKVTLDGEDAPSGRSYPRLSSYTPVVGDRVMLVRDRGGVWVILGHIV
jgi:hypothetical protein